MRVFRKRQLRLREENNESELNLTGDTSNPTDSVFNAQKNAKIAGKDATLTFPSNSSSPSNFKTVYSPSGNTSTTSDAATDIKPYLDKTPVTVHIGADGKVKNESRFSGDLIEGAVMFSKRELRDFLKRL
jgi:hypothetical protein